MGAFLNFKSLTLMWHWLCLLGHSLTNYGKKKKERQKSWMLPPGQWHSCLSSRHFSTNFESVAVLWVDDCWKLRTPELSLSKRVMRGMNMSLSNNELELRPFWRVIFPLPEEMLVWTTCLKSTLVRMWWRIAAGIRNACLCAPAVLRF